MKMIDKNTIPNSKTEKVLHLRSRKAQLLELAGSLLNDEITSLSQVNGYIWNTIEEIDGLLDE